MSTYTIEKEIDGEYFDIEIDIEDVLDFIENGASDSELEDIKEIFEDEIRDEIEDDLRDGIRDEIEEGIEEGIKEKFEDGQKPDNLYDEMKYRLVIKAMKKYSLEDLENKLNMNHMSV